MSFVNGSGCLCRLAFNRSIERCNQPTAVLSAQLIVFSDELNDIGNRGHRDFAGTTRTKSAGCSWPAISHGSMRWIPRRGPDFRRCGRRPNLGYVRLRWCPPNIYYSRISGRPPHASPPVYRAAGSCQTRTTNPGLLREILTRILTTSRRVSPPSRQTCPPSRQTDPPSRSAKRSSCSIRRWLGVLKPWRVVGNTCGLVLSARGDGRSTSRRAGSAAGP